MTYANAVAAPCQPSIGEAPTHDVERLLGRLGVDQRPIENRPHKIGELAKRYGVTLRTLRFYEEKGLATPKRRDRWSRVYERAHIERLDFLMACRETGLSVEDIADLMRLFDAGSADAVADALTKKLATVVANLDLQARDLAARRERAHGWLSRLTGARPRRGDPCSSIEG